jgi:hypothetical protein
VQVSRWVIVEKLPTPALSLSLSFAQPAAWIAARRGRCSTSWRSIVLSACAQRWVL